MGRPTVAAPAAAPRGRRAQLYLPLALRLIVSCLVSRLAFPPVGVKVTANVTCRLPRAFSSRAALALSANTSLNVPFPVLRTLAVPYV